MASTISARLMSKITVDETFTGGDAANNTLSFTTLNEDETLTASTSVPATKHAEGTLAMTAGAASLNLAALPGRTVDETVVGTGLKVQYAKFTNPTTNANPITIAEGASNGYALMGAGFTFTLAPGQSQTFKGNDAAPDIASGDRTIDISGTGTQALSYVLVMG